MASTFKIPYYLSVSQSDDFIDLLLRMHHIVDALVYFKQHNLIFHTLLRYIVIKFCAYNPTYLWNGVS